jgi:hypothetical protein
MRNYIWAALTAALLATPQVARSFEEGVGVINISVNVGDHCNGTNNIKRRS